MLSLFFRNLFFTLLQPGVVAGLVPYLLLKNARFPGPNDSFFLKVLAVVIGLAGLILMLDCIRRFASEGRGTLSPADPTKKLVISGLYRFTRNPMYIGVMGLLLGESMFWNHHWLWLYSAGVFLVFHLFIVFIEEPRLRRDFEADYSAYCKTVRRWI